MEDDALRKLKQRITELKKARHDVNTLLHEVRAEQLAKEEEMHKLSRELDAIKSKVDQKEQLVSQFDKTISESEKAYSKIIENSQLLLSALDRETQSLKGASTK
eukprot:GILK01007966.1.p1 GENE.GILK01007966.1~~GILK01007966.1.p1  ORF type:complete len:115 (-),score=27.73 GILK01007966.1:286-597(-)